MSTRAALREATKSQALIIGIVTSLLFVGIIWGFNNFRPLTSFLF